MDVLSLLPPPKWTSVTVLKKLRIYLIFQIWRKVRMKNKIAPIAYSRITNFLYIVNSFFPLIFIPSESVVVLIDTLQTRQHMMILDRIGIIRKEGKWWVHLKRDSAKFILLSVLSVINNNRWHLIWFINPEIIVNVHKIGHTKHKALVYGFNQLHNSKTVSLEFWLEAEVTCWRVMRGLCIRSKPEWSFIFTKAFILLFSTDES